MSKSITDELRKRFDRYTMRKDVYDELTAIADRIDAAHEEALVSAYFNGVFSDGELAENGFMRLPKGIDDKLINEHDKVDWRDHAGTWHENKTVVAVCSDGCYVLDSIVFHVHKSDIRHHHTNTVENVLSDFADRLYEKVAYVDEEHVQKAVTEYAAKLRLADDGKGQ